jgi:hypothetical protein
MILLPIVAPFSDVVRDTDEKHKVDKALPVLVVERVEVQVDVVVQPAKLDEKDRAPHAGRREGQGRQTEVDHEGSKARPERGKWEALELRHAPAFVANVSTKLVRHAKALADGGRSASEKLR